MGGGAIVGMGVGMGVAKGGLEEVGGWKGGWVSGWVGARRVLGLGQPLGNPGAVGALCVAQRWHACA